MFQCFKLLNKRASFYSEPELYNLSFREVLEAYQFDTYPRVRVVQIFDSMSRAYSYREDAFKLGLLSEDI